MSSDEEGVEGAEVWVAETWEAHGEGRGVQGIYVSREAAWDGLKSHVETLYVGEDGHLHGKPRHEEFDWDRIRRGYLRRWALAVPMKVQGRPAQALMISQTETCSNAS